MMPDRYDSLPFDRYQSLVLMALKMLVVATVVGFVWIVWVLWPDFQRGLSNRPMTLVATQVAASGPGETQSLSTFTLRMESAEACEVEAVKLRRRLTNDKAGISLLTVCVPLNGSDEGRS